MSHCNAQAKELIKRYLDGETLADAEYAVLYAVADARGQILENVVHMKIFEGWLTKHILWIEQSAKMRNKP